MEQVKHCEYMQTHCTFIVCKYIYTSALCTPLWPHVLCFPITAVDGQQFSTSNYEIIFETLYLNLFE